MHTLSAAKAVGAKKIVLAGGVSANTALRSSFEKAASENGMKFYCPPLVLCTDNAAMIGCAGYFKFLKGEFADSTLNAVANLKL